MHFYSIFFTFPTRQRFSKVGCQVEVQLGGTDPWSARGGPGKVEAGKSILFTESSPVEHLVYFVVTLTKDG